MFEAAGHEQRYAKNIVKLCGFFLEGVYVSPPPKAHENLRVLVRLSRANKRGQAVSLSNISGDKMLGLKRELKR